MNNIAKTTLQILCPILFASCTVDVALPSPLASNPQSYCPLTIGSYWVYDWYQTDSTGALFSLSTSDSCFVSNDTVIGGDTFYIIEGTFRGDPSRSWLRDSSGCFISPSGRIALSATNFTDTFYTWSSSVSGQFGYLMMAEIGETVTVPAGSFRTINAKYTVINTTGTWPCFGIYDEHDNQYALGVGLVRTAIPHTSSPSCRTDLRLLRSYSIQ